MPWRQTPWLLFLGGNKNQIMFLILNLKKHATGIRNEQPKQVN